MWRELLLLPLAACSAAPGPCRLERVADLPVTLAGNRVELEARVSGAPVRLVVDTGAEASLLTTETIASLGLPRARRSATRLVGVGGAVSNADVFADVEVGSVDVRRRFAVANIPGLGGLVGADVLSGYDLEFDLPASRVRLWRAAGCGAADLPWAGPRTAVPMRVDAGLVRVQVSLDGHPVSALLDSGASRSLLQASAAFRAGATEAMLAADPASVMRGVDGAAISVHAHRFGALAVGGEHVAGARIGVAEFGLRTTDMLLGVDWLQLNRVWVSYRAEQLFIQPAPRG